jgi:uncharacterized protein YhhL (DUF1145 family)
LTINLTRVFALALWVACIVSLLVTLPEGYRSVILMIGGLVLLLHFLEYLLVRSKVAAKLDGKTGFIQTMMFGFAFWWPVLREK